MSIDPGVDPGLAGLLSLLASAPRPTAEPTPEQARALLRTMVEAGESLAPRVEVAAVTEASVDGADGALAARVYRPRSAGPHPTLVFFHGGGFALGDLDTHDGQARLLCAGSDVVVLSVDYRLAPEHPFPAGVRDAVAATHWAAGQLGELGGDARLAVGGDSAGGNLAALVAQQCRSAGGPELAGQLLIYPALDLSGSRPSVHELAEGYYLTGEDMTWFQRLYVPDGTDLHDPALSPLFAASLAGLAPAVVATGEFDPLRDEGDDYAAALAAAGVGVRHRRHPGMIHGFFGMTALSPSAAQAADWVCSQLHDLLAAG